MNLKNHREKIDPASTALVIIDMQRDYCCEGGIFDKMGFDIKAASLLAPRLSDFAGKVRPLLRHIIFVRMEHNPHMRSPALEEQYGRTGVKVIREAAYSELYVVKPGQGDIVVPKYRYSAFVSTYFDQCLRSNGIRTLVLSGVATNVCIESTARDGFMKDYHIVVPEDMTEGTSAEAKKWSLFNIDTFFGEVVDSTDLLTCWGLNDLHGA
jgi:ureidoacrylate peracid hydrolase